MNTARIFFTPSSPIRFLKWVRSEGSQGSCHWNCRWTKKDSVNYYGYKNHILVDRQIKLVRHYDVTTVDVHDSRPAAGLIWTDDISDSIDHLFKSIARYRFEDARKVLTALTEGFTNA